MVKHNPLTNKKIRRMYFHCTYNINRQRDFHSDFWVFVRDFYDTTNIEIIHSFVF